MLPALATCGQYVADASECSPIGPSASLPGRLRETSGVAIGVRNPDLIWTHNDGRRSTLYAVDHDGRVRARVELDRSFRDWEDIARARCDVWVCLYMADTGDNEERRDNISFYRLAEPDQEGVVEVEGIGEAERYRVALPDGPRDIEAMYVLPTDEVFFVTKGRNHPVTLYRHPLPLRSEEVVTLVEVQRLTTGPVAARRMVTGASATLDGGTVVVRTYESLEFFDVAGGERGGARQPSVAPRDTGGGRRVRGRRSDRPQLRGCRRFRPLPQVPHVCPELIHDGRLRRLESRMKPSVTPRFCVLAAFLVATAPALLSAQVADPDATRFADAIAEFAAYDAKNSFPADATVFVGSSSTVRWDTGDSFRGLPLLNRSFGGSQMSDAVYWVEETVLKYAPRTVVVYEGDNDTNAGKRSRQLLEDYKEFVEAILEAQPSTRIVIMSIKPSLARWDVWAEMKE
jgi:hypothetical protein